MNDHKSVGIVMIEDDEGHARLIEKNIRRAGILNGVRRVGNKKNQDWQLSGRSATSLPAA